MVDDRVTDGTRIGQLLASELTGLRRGPLGMVEVVGADPDVEPTAEGAFAYGVEADEQRIGAVYVTPETAEFRTASALTIAFDRDDVTVDERDGETVVVAHSGAAVKALVDAVADAL
ncbi:hypothetical protein [Haloarcula marina]|uniref:hypothetical protein n=1 Tax=Haloarcula marina TaxID=2961574 RepID=UPI0020B8D0E9|nr:hypothetical protein [Halomicroarcula marina]